MSQGKDPVTLGAENRTPLRDTTVHLEEGALMGFLWHKKGPLGTTQNGKRQREN